MTPYAFISLALASFAVVLGAISLWLNMLRTEEQIQRFNDTANSTSHSTSARETGAGLASQAQANPAPLNSNSATRSLENTEDARPATSRRDSVGSVTIRIQISTAANAARQPVNTAPQKTADITNL